MASVLAFPEDDFDQPDEAWFIEPKDDDPRDEFKRQSAFVNIMRRDHPGVIVYAIPNGAKMTDWQKIRRQKEGAVAGAPDLIIMWPRGEMLAEFKDGKGRPSPEQRRELNRLTRLGRRCGVYRTAALLLTHLRAAGCPV